MQELRFVRREDSVLIVADDTDTEYRLIVDDALQSEMRHLQRRTASGPRISPRTVQTMLREGKSVQEVAKKLGVAEEDIERFAEPVLAERRYILDRAGSVAVRPASTKLGDNQQLTFREVIDERLLALGASDIEWNVWRDEEGWHISLSFSSHGTPHHAVWMYDHRRHVLGAENTDAVNLSQQEDVGDRLIPRLRVVQGTEPEAGPAESEVAHEEPHQPALPVDPHAPTHNTATVLRLAQGEPAADEAEAADEPATAVTDSPAEPAPAAPIKLVSKPADESEDEFLRRKEIDHWAVNTADTGADMTQTADLLDALRKRRDERAHGRDEDPGTRKLAPVAQMHTSEEHRNTPGNEAVQEQPEVSTPIRLHAVEAPASQLQVGPAPVSDERAGDSAAGPADEAAPAAAEGTATTQDAEDKPAASEKKPKKNGRASIPKWEDILFGTRSEEDPA